MPTQNATACHSPMPALSQPQDWTLAVPHCNTLSPGSPNILQLRCHSFWETVLSQVKTCQLPPHRQHFGWPLSRQAQLHVLPLPAGLSFSYWTRSFWSIPSGLLTAGPHLAVQGTVGLKYLWRKANALRPPIPKLSPQAWLLKAKDSAGFISAYSLAPGLAA